MTITETDETCESQLIVERTVPAKYVLDPKLLTTELERLFGEGKFAVEMRHNCYQIKTSKEFKLADLVRSCPSLRRIPSNASSRLSFKQQIDVH
ncbi:hypothetical protein FJTKL_12003 [Diaporthe vaccinii]|uniref:Uncharacterized protein n=1 Tax=Diaporthe vaccinii TaxID=105482 RepID=A0ABR4FBF5_9PEZI